jgi:hypothetical protein
MEPYCNIITLTVTQYPLGYTVDGNDNQCGAGGKLSGATGQVVFNPDGTLGLYFTTVTSPGGKTVHVTALISPATGSGTWTDSVGNSGNFLLGAPGAGSPRPTGASQAAFVFQVTASNICSTGASYAVIDHPITNNDSTAIVLATPKRRGRGRARPAASSASPTLSTKSLTGITRTVRFRFRLVRAAGSFAASTERRCRSISSSA